MLKHLRISNYVIIREADLTFGEGLNMLTGETGAGKSIILGALGLVLGRRADTQVLFDPETKAIVEAYFHDSMGKATEIIREHDIDDGPEIILRREISPNGRSRAFVNDTPVTLDIITGIGAALIDIHEQFETLEIQQASEQYQVLDAYCQIQGESGKYRKDFQRFTDLKSRLTALRERQAQALKEKDYLTFQLQEFESLPLEPEGLAAMEEEFQLQSGSEEIKASVLRIVDILGGDESVTDLLQAQLRELTKLAQGNSKLSALIQRVDELVELSKDVSLELSHFSDEIDPNPARKEQLEEKLDVINRVMLKHGASDETTLMSVRDRLESQLQQWTNLDGEIEDLETELNHKVTDLEKQAEAISSTRHLGAPKLGKEVTDALEALSMKNARLKIAVQPSEVLHLYGKDHIEFLFAPNLGSDPKPVRKVASGGELSRLNLCLKSAISDSMQLPTLVFDEIDAGVSGEVAMRMGQKLKALSSGHQVIMITHSPQIAAQAGNHLQVAKSDESGRTVALVRTLSRAERVNEIAKMLSGDPPTKAAIQNAKTLIES